MRTKLQHVHFEGFNFWHFLIFILLHQNCGFKRTIAKSIYRLILNILWLFYSIKYGIDIGYTFMIIIEIDNIMGGNNILWTVECEREETCFYYYSWEFLKGKKEDFLLTVQIYECEYWLHICKNICCNTEHLSHITCEFYFSYKNIQFTKLLLKRWIYSILLFLKVKFYYHQITIANVYRAPNQTFQDIWKSKGTYFTMMHRE